MPYVTPSLRKSLHADQEYPELRPSTSGELSYCIAKTIRDYLKQKPNGGWSAISDVYGALAGAKLAFEQEVVIPYETIKLAENGPVFREF